MAKTQIDIYQKKDGFWVGRMLKNGQMAAGSYHITDEDIMTMFSTVYERCVAETGEQKMLMKTADGSLLVTLKVPVAKTGEAEE